MIEKSMQDAGKKSLRLGELLVEDGLIKASQLKEALTRQARSGGQIGSILVEMGFITTDDLLTFLSRQLGIPSTDLLKIDISPGALKLMPIEKIKAMKVMPIRIDDNSVTLAMVNPRDVITIRDIEFSLGKKVTPVVVASSQMEAAIQTLTSHPESFLTGYRMEETHKPEIRKVPSLESLLKYLAASHATDMLLTAGIPPCIKNGSDLVRTSMDSLTPSDCEKFARELMTEKNWEKFVAKREYDFTVTCPDTGRCRINLYMQRNSVSISLRRIADILPSLEELGLPGWLNDRVLTRRGLILISSPAGHGKSTTLASLVDLINAKRSCNIITLEDPIEYLHKHKKSNVNQREVGTDTESFHAGMKHIYRQNPDVIAVDGMEDADGFAVALEAADTAHLVIAALNARTAASTIEKIINIFPSDRQCYVRARIADNLLFVLSQRLIPVKEGEGRVLAYEKMMNSDDVKNLTREGKIQLIGADRGRGTEEYTPLESSLAKFHSSGLITFEDGLLFADDKQLYKDLTRDEESRH